MRGGRTRTRGPRRAAARGSRTRLRSAPSPRRLPAATQAEATSAGAIASICARTRSSSDSEAAAISLIDRLPVGERCPRCRPRSPSPLRRCRRGAPRACRGARPGRPPGSAGRRSRRPGTRASRARARAARRPRRSRTRSRRPPFLRAGSRLQPKPIVTRSTWSKSPPSSSTTARRTASSDGSPATPTSMALELARASDAAGRAARSPRQAGRWTSAPTATTSSPRSSARPRSWMSSTAMSARRVASSLSESGLPPAGGRIWMSHAVLEVRPRCAPPRRSPACAALGVKSSPTVSVRAALPVSSSPPPQPAIATGASTRNRRIGAEP